MGLLVMAVVVIFGYSSYALFMRVDRYDTAQAMSIGDLGIAFSVPSLSGIPNHLILKDVTPMSDTAATSMSYDGNKLAFAVTNYGKEKSDYMVYLTDLVKSDLVDSKMDLSLDNMISHEYLKIQIDGDKIYKLSDLEDGKIYEGEIIFGEDNIIYHTIRVWIDESYTGNVNEINLKLTFESVLQSENQKRLSLSYNILEKSGGSEGAKAKDASLATTAGLYYDAENKVYYYKGKVDNDNLVYGKDAEGNDLNWKIIEFSEDHVKVVLNNATMIKALKAKYADIDASLDSWYESFSETSKETILLGIGNKKYSTLNYNEISRSGLLLGEGLYEYSLSAKIDAWLLGENINKLSSDNGIEAVSESESNYLFPVISIRGMIKFKSGSGLEGNPYRFEY